MERDNVIYTDGRDVTVTDSTLKVRNHAWGINGIMRSTLWTIKPARGPALILMLLGLGLAISGWLDVLPATMAINSGSETVSVNTLALWSGLALIVVAIITLAVSRQRYAVRIVTAEGEKDALVSTKREYVAQIVNAIDRAFANGYRGPYGSAETQSVS